MNIREWARVNAGRKVSLASKFRSGRVGAINQRDVVMLSDPTKEPITEIDYWEVLYRGATYGLFLYEHDLPHVVFLDEGLPPPYLKNVRVTEGLSLLDKAEAAVKSKVH